MSLIVFAGTDRCGKTTISKEFCKRLNKEYDETTGGAIPSFCSKVPECYGTTVQGYTRSYLGPFEWTKEPLFTSEEADRLNSFSGPEHQYERELLFYESRLNHQEFLEQHNVVCDRYLWCGMAYAKVFSPKCYETYKRLYMNKRFFIQPDLYIYVNAHIDTVMKRDPSLNRDTILDLWKAYETVYDDIEELEIPIITINNEPRCDNKEESINLVLDELMAKFKKHLWLVSSSVKG